MENSYSSRSPTTVWIAFQSRLNESTTLMSLIVFY